MKTPVTATWWAEADKARMESFRAELPAALAGEHALWQLRVDQGAETPHMPHTRLFIMQAVECARTEIEPGKGRSEPTGKSISILVAAQDGRAAVQKVRAQLTAHGLDPNSYLLRHSESILCLA